MQINLSQHPMEFSDVFINMINIYTQLQNLHSYRIAGLHCLKTLHIGKSKTSEVTTKTGFRKYSANKCSVKVSKIHSKVPVPGSH